MMEDDERPVPPALDALMREDLDRLSVYELEARRKALEGEIARIKAAMKAKAADHAAAEALFSKG